jgi:hypothetical protein
MLTMKVRAEFISDIIEEKSAEIAPTDIMG